MDAINNNSIPVTSFFEEPQPNQRKTTVVYLDGSHGRFEGVNYIGTGIFMVNEDGSNLKIANGYCESRNKSAVQAERQTFIDFVTFVHEANLHENTDFIIYGDSEPIIKFLNIEDKHDGGVLGFSKDFISAVKQISIKGAYWVKGHRMELGNLVVDALASNAMRYSMFRKKELNGLYENTPMSSLLDGFVRKCANLVRQEEDEYLFNKKCFDRHLKTNENIIEKEMSSKLPDRVKLQFTGKVFRGVVEDISTDDDDEAQYVMSHDIEKPYTEHKMFKQLLGDALRIKQVNAFANKPIEIYISQGYLSHKVDGVILEYKKLQQQKKQAKFLEREEAIQQYREDMKVFLSVPLNRQISELCKFPSVTIKTNYVKPEKAKKKSLGSKP